MSLASLLSNLGIFRMLSCVIKRPVYLAVAEFKLETSLSVKYMYLKFRSFIVGLLFEYFGIKLLSWVSTSCVNAGTEWRVFVTAWSGGNVVVCAKMPPAMSDWDIGRSVMAGRKPGACRSCGSSP